LRALKVILFDFIMTKKGNYYSFLFWRLLIAFGLLWLSRWLFYFSNLPYFSHLSLAELLKIVFAGVRFDLSSVIVLNSVFIFLMIFPSPFRNDRVYRITSDFFFYLGNIAGLMVNIIDMVYYRFTQKRMTGEIFEYVSNDISLGDLLPQFFADFWPFFILFFFLIWGFIFVSRKIRIKVSDLKIRILQYYLFQTLFFILSLGGIIIALRGGFQLKPINIITAGRYTEARNAPLLLNTPFTIMKTINQKGLIAIRYFDEKKMEQMYDPVFTREQIQVLYPDTVFRPKNVVIFIMESLSAEHVGAFNTHIPDYQGFTPFLDSLMQHSLVFNGFANGKQSIEGIPAVVSSIPSLLNRPYINSTYAANRINSLTGLLNEKNYSTAFYHGGTNGTMDFDGFADMVGFQKYYGRTEYNNDADFDGNWGIFDEPFFQYCAKNFDGTQQPFFATIFSISAHHPYFIPPQHQGKFRKGKLEIQETIMYSDYALKKFFETAVKSPWYNNTIFVITADHTSEAYLPEYKTRYGMYRIPIVYFDPSSQLNMRIQATSSQVDIMPTILSFLNYDKPFVSFGQNLFGNNPVTFAVNYLNGIYQMIRGDFVLEFDGEKSLALYNVANDILTQRNLLTTNPGKVTELENQLKAYIQQFNNRMIENRLTPEDGKSNQ